MGARYLQAFGKLLNINQTTDHYVHLGTLQAASSYNKLANLCILAGEKPHLSTVLRI